jgi:hypothetical protein
MRLHSSLLRYALVALVSALMATATVATAVYAHNDGFSERILACFESRDPNSEECDKALKVSPVGADFFSALAASLADRPPRPEPKPEPRTDLWTLIKECAATQDFESAECNRALEASGLSAEEFRAKLNAKFGCVFANNRGDENPCAKKAARPAELSEWMRQCLELRASVNGLPASELMAKAEKLNIVCGRALHDSGMSAAQFWAHYR